MRDHNGACADEIRTEIACEIGWQRSLACSHGLHKRDAKVFVAHRVEENNLQPGIKRRIGFITKHPSCLPLAVPLQSAAGTASCRGRSQAAPAQSMKRRKIVEIKRRKTQPSTAAWRLTRSCAFLRRPSRRARSSSQLIPAPRRVNISTENRFFLASTRGR